MINIRRWYVFLVCAISLQAVTWAIITLLRNLLVPALSPASGGVSFAAEVVAFQIAIIVIGLPIFLVHWLWAGRLAGQEREERTALLRSVYLYGMMAGFLSPFSANAFTLLNSGLRRLLSLAPSPYVYPQLDLNSALIYYTIPLIILGVLWLYHHRIAVADVQYFPDSESDMTIRRFYLYGFSAVGLTLATLGVVALFRWLLFQISNEQTVIGLSLTSLPTELTRLLIGIPLWLIFWQRAQTQFVQDTQDQASVIRKFYLYLAVFVGVFSVVASASGILVGVLRNLLNLPSTGDIRNPIAVILGTAVLWAYHAVVLRRDAAAAVEQPRQAVVRRIYLYLVAGVGLAALLIGVGGVISVIIRSVAGQAFFADLRTQLADFTGALIAGLPVWLIHWRQAHLAAETDDAGGHLERTSLTRKIYLYFYLFVATLTVLTSAVYIVFQLVSLALGARTAVNLFSELSHAIAYTLLAVAIWIYHGRMLRQDGRFETATAFQALAAWHVAVLDGDDGRFGHLLLERLKQDLPQLNRQAVGLTPSAAEQMGTEMVADLSASLKDADLIVVPWTVLLADQPHGVEAATAVAQSPARKLLLPAQRDGWEWIGAESWVGEEILEQAVHGIKQVVRGKPVEPRRRLNLWGIIIAVIVGLFLFGIVLSAIGNLFF